MRTWDRYIEYVYIAQRREVNGGWGEKKMIMIPNNDNSSLPSPLLTLFLTLHPFLARLALLSSIRPVQAAPPVTQCHFQFATTTRGGILDVGPSSPELPP